MIDAPTPRRAPVETVVHGQTLVDAYAWMRDAGYPTVDDAEILAHLEAENAHHDAWMAERGGLIDRIEAELRGRIKEDDAAVPWRDGDWVYRWRFAVGAQHRVWERRPAADDAAAWSVLIDEPALAAGSEFFRLGGYAVSPDGARLARAVDRDGSERFTLEVVDIATGAAVGAPVENTIGSPVWSDDGATLLYMELSPEWRPFRVRALAVGAEAAEPAILYEEADPSFFVGISTTQSRRFIVIAAGDHQTSEVRLVRRDAPLSKSILLAPRREKHEYDVDHAAGGVFIRTNDGAQNFRVAWAPDDAPEEANWRPLIDGSDAVYIRDATAFRDHLVLSERVDGLDQIRLRAHADGSEHRIAFPEASYAAGLGVNAEPTADRLRVRYESMVTPATVFDYDVSARRLETLKVQEIPSGYDPARYETLRRMIEVRDGVRVPASLVRLRDPAARAEPKLHLSAYGSYGMGRSPGFSTARLSLVDRGLTVGIAHTRGGDELGYGWYESGRAERRENTFHDLIDVAEGLARDGFAVRGRITASGGSAGGQVMGVVLNRAPDLWGGIVADVPFVDVLNTMLDASLPLTPIEWKEWGDPITDAAAFNLIRGYCPYQNVAAVAHPPVLATAGLSDPRVTYWEPAKWVAKLREIGTGSGPVLLKTNMGAGHAGKSGRFERLREIAESYAFLLWSHGVED